MHPEEGRKQVNGSEPPIRLGYEGGDDIPGRGRVLSHRFGDLKKMAHNDEEAVRKFADVTWLPAVYLGSTFFECAGNRP
jgi:hypothetical protein